MTYLCDTFQCLLLKVAMLNLNVCILLSIFNVIILLFIYSLLWFIIIIYYNMFFFLSECISPPCVCLVPTWADGR